jgi:hypothetical protein
MACELWQPEVKHGHLDELTADGGVLGDNGILKGGASICSVIA